MIDLSNVIDVYKQLPLEQKSEKIIGLLEIFAQYRAEITEVIEFIKQGKISEQDMIDTYISLVTSINEVKKESLEKSLDKITLLHQKILAIHQAEEADKVKEGNPDEMLKNL